jgi:hypothetical protein
MELGGGSWGLGNQCSWNLQWKMVVGAGAVGTGAMDVAVRTQQQWEPDW